jgi:hypothetical protein
MKSVLLSAPPKHASEAAAVQVDRVQHLTALANAHAPLVGYVSVPDGAFRVQANAMRDAAVEVRPKPWRFDRLPSGAMSNAVSLLA